MIEAEHRGETLVLAVGTARIDAAQVVAFKEAVRDAADGAPGAGRVVMDLSRVEFIDSSGLGALVASAKALGADRRMELSGARPLVRKVLALTHLDRVFALHDDLEAALHARDAA